MNDPTLRDLFAGLAMAGYIMSGKANNTTVMARRAFHIADQMMEARDEQAGETGTDAADG
jgi:hypothetical protein